MHDINPRLRKLTVDDLARPHQMALSPRGPVPGVERLSLIALAAAGVTALTLVVYGATSVKAGAAKTGRPIPHPAAAAVNASPDLDLLADYLVCPELAEIRALDTAEAMACADLYSKVKLSFLPKSEAAALDALSPSERAKANRTGYAQYHAWRTANSALVEEMEAAARARIGDAGM